MKISGKEIAQKILQSLKVEIANKKLSLGLAIILAGGNISSRVYIASKIKSAEEIGMKAFLYEFNESEMDKCKQKIIQLNNDPVVNGIIIQQPMYKNWKAKEFFELVDPKKDVDGFLDNSPFTEATALAVWEMLSAFAEIEGFSKVEEFLNNKKIVVLGRGLTAGKPITELLRKKGFEVEVIHSQTENPNEIIFSSDIVISATGKKNIINSGNIKFGAYVIGVGVGKEEVDGNQKIFGDINEEEVAKIARLYCPTIGGIGPLTVASLLKNVVKSTLV